MQKTSWQANWVLRDEEKCKSFQDCWGRAKTKTTRPFPGPLLSTPAMALVFFLPPPSLPSPFSFFVENYKQTRLPVLLRARRSEGNCLAHFSKESHSGWKLYRVNG